MTFRPARILVLRGGALGDFVVTLPALQALRARWPDGRLEVIGYPAVARLALRGGLADVVHSLDQSGMARFFSARPAFSEEQADFIRSFDVVLCYLHDPHGILEENLRLAGARVLLMASPLVGAGHAVDHFLRPLESLAIYEADAVPRLAVTATPDPRSLVIHPGSGSRRKNWPLERFLALAERARAAGWAPHFLLGEVERDLAPTVQSAGFPLTVDAPLDTVAERLAGCAGYLGNDSGISHLAAACGARCVVLFGPTDADQWAPRGAVQVVRAEGGDLANVTVAEVWPPVAGLRGG